VKSFGELLVRDHRRATRMVDDLAKRRGVKLPPLNTKGEADGHMASLKALRKLRGAEFDRKFLATMFEEHERGLSEVRDAYGRVRHTEVRSLLGKLIPVLEQHRDLAQKLSRKAAPAS
jgi:putative membrane protein